MDSSFLNFTLTIELKRSLNAMDLIAYGLASTLGTGILVTVGAVAHENAGVIGHCHKLKKKDLELFSLLY